MIHNAPLYRKKQHKEKGMGNARGLQYLQGLREECSVNWNSVDMNCEREISAILTVEIARDFKRRKIQILPCERAVVSILSWDLVSK